MARYRLKHLNSLMITYYLIILCMNSDTLAIL